MAPKKPAKKRGSVKRREAAVNVLLLTRKAKAEVKKLLKRDQAGTITRKRLQTGLCEVDERLKRMVGMIRHLL